MSDNKNNFVNKLLYLLLGGIASFIVLIGLVYVVAGHSSGLLLLWIPFLVLISSLIGGGIWFFHYKDKFETILVWLTYLFFGFSFIIMAPIAIDRSLSTFIFFYTVEHQEFSKDKISKEYIDDFINKRFEDALRGGFLIQENEKYKPNYRAKIYYYIFYPLGMVTNTLGNYKKFEARIENDE